MEAREEIEKLEGVSGQVHPLIHDTRLRNYGKKGSTETVWQEDILSQLGWGEDGTKDKK